MEKLAYNRMTIDRTNQNNRMHKANDSLKRPPLINKLELNREKENLLRNTRREVSRSKNETKATYTTVKLVKPKKPLKVIWQRLSAGHAEHKTIKKSSIKTARPNQPCCCNGKPKQEPAWREILADKKCGKKMRRDNSVPEVRCESSRTTAVQIHMEQRTEHFVETRREVNTPKLDRLDSNAEIEPIEEFREFFENLFKYLEVRVPLHEREFLMVERERFDGFFERLKLYDAQQTGLIDGQIAPTTSNATLNAQNSTEIRLKNLAKIGQAEMGVQTSFPSSLNESEGAEKTPIEKVDKSIQVSSKEAATRGSSKVAESERESGGKEGRGIFNKTNEKCLTAVTQEIDNLEILKNELKRNPNMDVLLRSVKSFYKRVKKQHKTRNVKTTQNSTSQTTKNDTKVDSSSNSKVCEVNSKDFQKQKEKSDLVLAQNAESPIDEFNTFLPKLQSTMKKVSDKSILISGVISKYTRTPSADMEQKESKREVLPKELNAPQMAECSDQVFPSQNNLQFEIHTICNNLMDTKNDLAMLKDEMEKETITIVEDEAIFEINDSMQLSQFAESIPTSYEQPLPVPVPLPVQLPVPVPSLALERHANKFQEISGLFTDQLAKSTLEDIKQKVTDTEKMQQEEIENLLKEKPHIDETGLLHKLDSNMEKMQSTLIKLGKHYNYLPIEFLNQTYQTKWKSNDGKSNVLLDSFKNCYPEKLNTCRELDRRLPTEIEQYEEMKAVKELREALIHNENNISEIESSFDNVNNAYA